MTRTAFAQLIVLTVAALLASAAAATATDPGRPPAAQCALLDDPGARPYMGGLLRHLLEACGRTDELGRVAQTPAMAVAWSELGATDVPVNDPAGEDVVASHTQSTTTVAFSADTGTLCAAYNDSFHDAFAGDGLVGLSRSNDGGAAFADRGPLDAAAGGDPMLAWREQDGAFYLTALAISGDATGVGLWRSTDDCQSFELAATVSGGAADDRPALAVDNHATTGEGLPNPYSGRIYVAWTDFDLAGDVYVTHSADGGATWAPPVPVSDTADGAVQGAWMAVGADGTLAVTWLKYRPGDTFDIELATSSDGGATFQPATPPALGLDLPRDAAASTVCSRNALNGNLAYQPTPQLAAGPDGSLHVVYSADPDGPGPDAVDVFYRRSADGGVTWQPSQRVNDDATATDQFFPTLSVGPSNAVAVAWYDRRHDQIDNQLVEYFQRLSYDGGVSWQPSQRLSDVASPIYLDPALPTCYHGDYDGQVQTGAAAVALWADDRNLQGGHNDPDVYADSSPVSSDFLLLPTPRAALVCAPADAGYTIEVPQFDGFAEQVQLSAPGLPTGLSAGFQPATLTPPATSFLTVSGSGAVAPGSYDLTLLGTAASASHQADVVLTVFDAVPTLPTPTSPGAGATEVELRPVLRWDAAAGAAGHDYQIAADAAFSDLIETGTTAALAVRLSAALAPDTTYWWRVRGGNPCGGGPWTAAASFTTRSVPPILLVDDDDGSPDVRSSYADTLASLGEPFDVWDTAGGDEPEAADLAPYSIVIWFSGDKFGGADGTAGPDDASETALAGWLDGGACFLLSSQDYYWDNLQTVTPFMAAYLGVAAVANDAGTTSVTGTAGAAFEGLGPYTLSYPFDDVSDGLTPDGSAAAALQGSTGTVALSRTTAGSYTVFMGFPFEALPTPAAREAVLEAALTACRRVIVTEIFADGFETGDTSYWSTTSP